MTLRNSERVEKEILDFPSGILADLLHILEMIEDLGPNLGKPHTAAMGDGLFEIRAKGVRMSRTTLKEFKKKAFQNTEVQEEYDLLRPEYAIKKKLIAMRKEAGLTQEKLAELMGTRKSNISRLESFKSSISPRIDTLMNYAKATGHELKVDFV